MTASKGEEGSKIADWDETEKREDRAAKSSSNTSGEGVLRLIRVSVTVSPGALAAVTLPYPNEIK